MPNRISLPSLKPRKDMGGMYQANSLAASTAGARILNLLGQCVEVGQKKIRQVVHLISDFLRGLLITVDSFVAIQSQIVRPIFNRWSNAMFGRKLVDALHQRPRFQIWSQLFERHFQTPPVTTAGCIPELCPASFNCFDIRPCCPIGHRLRRCYERGRWPHVLLR